MDATLNPAQKSALAEEMDKAGATAFTVARDEPNDGHVFVALYRGRGYVGEIVIEDDGRIEE